MFNLKIEDSLGKVVGVSKYALWCESKDLGKCLGIGLNLRAD